MPLDFPSNPSVDQVYSVGSRTWKYNGVAWDQISTTVGPTGPTGPQGPAGTGTVSSSLPSGGNNGDIWLVVY